MPSSYTARGEVLDQPALWPLSSSGKHPRRPWTFFRPRTRRSPADFSDPIVLTCPISRNPPRRRLHRSSQEASPGSHPHHRDHSSKPARSSLVNLAKHPPRPSGHLVVRHYDRCGVLAFVMDAIRRAEINIEGSAIPYPEGPGPPAAGSSSTKTPLRAADRALRKANKDINLPLNSSNSIDPSSDP